ncbi:MAG: Electron transport complex subunit RsxB [Bacteroidetes bacterium ADurb.Bin416]|nr:MAG: Electron transport complex subunit RsxB [Bacteroidetes bacterium ADurb.Bin416]
MIIAIASGKGGTGKTLVSTNLFQVSLDDRVDVVLVDCDAEEPNDAVFLPGEPKGMQTVTQQMPVIDKAVCTYCGRCHDWCSYNAIFFLREPRRIDVLEDLCHDCGACLAACKVGAITEKTVPIGTLSTRYINKRPALIEGRTLVGTASPVKIIKQAISEAGKHDLVILDAPPGISCPFIATVEPADYVVLVTEPTPFGLNDLALSIETLEQMGKPYGVVVNRAGLGDEALYRWLVDKGVLQLADIPFDRAIASVYAEGKLVVKVLPAYKPVFQTLLDRIRAQAHPSTIA